MSQTCQISHPALLDHVIRPSLKCGRHGYAEGPGGCKIDRKRYELPRRAGGYDRVLKRVGIQY
jgi:hypothetical protein